MDIFPNNTRSKFRSYINQQDLNYITQNQDLQFAVKSITLDNDLNEDTHLILRSNLSYDTISSFGYDNIISCFSLQKVKWGVNIYRFENPVFFPTSHQKLCNALFTIIDLSTNEQPAFKYASPTFIEIVVRRVPNRMKPPFTLLLDSSCEESLKRFPENTNTCFTIQLPKRFEFNKDWILCLKSLHHDVDKFEVEQNCFIIVEGRYHGNFFSQKHSFTLRSDSVPDMLVKLRTVFKQYKIKVNIIKRRFSIDPPSESDLKQFSIEHLPESDTKRTSIEYLPGDPLLQEITKIQISHDLSNILGIGDASISMNRKRPFFAYRKVNMLANQPNHFIVCCNIVEESVLGGHPVQILKYFPRDARSNFDIEFTNNDFVKLNCKSFDRIQIRIADLTGRTVRTLSRHSTRMQILFVNTNSIE